MNLLKRLPDKWLSSIRGLFDGDARKREQEEANRGNGQTLLRLHEYQHRVIVEIFRVSIAGFLGFTLILMGFSIYAFSDPAAPGWMAIVVVVLCVGLLIALYHTVQEFKVYRKNYRELTNRLRVRLQNQAAAKSPGNAGKVSVEHRLLSALKPKEHSGWDHKSCQQCSKAIELLANVCQHCGQEQETLHIN